MVTDAFEASTRRGVKVDAGLSLTITDYPDFSSHFAADEFEGSYVASRNVLTTSHRFSIHKAQSNVDMLLGPIQPVRVRQYDDWMDMVQFDLSFGQDSLEVEAIFHILAGRLNSFWKPTWLPDFNLKENAVTGQSFIRVDPIRDGTSIEAIAIELIDGTTHYHRVSSWNTPSSYSQITLSTPLASDVEVSQVVTVSLMRLSRLISDEISFTFDRVGGSTVQAATIGVVM